MDIAFTGDTVQPDEKFRSLDIPFLEKHFCKDVSLLTEVLRSYKESSQKTLISMRQALMEHDKDGLMRAAHLLRGSSLNFLQDSFVKTLKNIELSIKSGGDITLEAVDLEFIEKQVNDLIHQLEVLIKKWNFESNV